MELFANPADMKEKDKRLDPEINYLDDLKVFIDNEDSVLSKFFFPAIHKHKDHGDQEDSFKLYLHPVKQTIPVYCKKYNLEDIQDQVFSKEDIIKVAKKFAEEQQRHIKKKDYDE
jgi:hemerythrin-like domain-containing protein